MKPVVIIDTFPNSREAYLILNDSIDSFKSMGYDVMLVSHMYIEQTTAKKCKYVIYDDNNKFLSRKHCPCFITYSQTFILRWHMVDMLFLYVGI